MGTVLFLCQRIPFPPDKGDKIRSYHLLAHLASHYDIVDYYYAEAPDLDDLDYLLTLSDQKDNEQLLQQVLLSLL